MAKSTTKSNTISARARTKINEPDTQSIIDKVLVGTFSAGIATADTVKAHKREIGCVAAGAGAVLLIQELL